jgi:hypothetical protein
VRADLARAFVLALSLGAACPAGAQDAAEAAALLDKMLPNYCAMLRLAARARQSGDDERAAALKALEARGREIEQRNEPDRRRFEAIMEKLSSAERADVMRDWETRAKRCPDAAP